MRRFDFVPESSPLYHRMKEVAGQQGPRGFRDFVPERDLASRAGISDDAASFQDKRSVELECQFCEKTCKGLGGLSAHIRSNHPEEYEQMKREKLEMTSKLPGAETEEEEETSEEGDPEEETSEEDAETEEDKDGNPNSDCPEGF